MSIEYKLLNEVQAQSAHFATLVFAPNTYAEKPIKNCKKKKKASGDSGTSASFEYAPWQYLNPSSGAQEKFFYDSQVFIVAKSTLPDPGSSDPKNKADKKSVDDEEKTSLCLKSVKTLVQPGCQYTLVPTQDRFQITETGSNGSKAMTVQFPHLPLGPETVDIEWYMGSSLQDNTLVGTTFSVAAKNIAWFQIHNNVLLFMPELPAERKDYYAASEITNAMKTKEATKYEAAITTTSVEVQFQQQLDLKDDGRIYVFDPADIS